MTDISSKKEIVLLVDLFYEKILADKTIGHFFTTVKPISKEKHMPVMYAFWESVLLDGTDYAGNPMLKHISLDQLERVEECHFDVWINHWTTTIDENFKGEIASMAKQKAIMMKDLMLYKIKASRKDHFIQ